MSLPPQPRFRLQLTPAEIAIAEQLVNSYFDFWSHARFRLGIDVPPFSQREVQSDLYCAAYDVARIQSYLDLRQPDFKLRLVGGNARSYLHSLTALPDDRGAFVRDICLASFQDGAGNYVESSAEEISEFLAELQRLKDEARRRRPRRNSSQ